MIIVTSSFSKSSVFKMFPFTRKRSKSWHFQIPPFNECFRKPLFWLRISVDGRPNRRNKAVFSNSSDPA